MPFESEKQRRWMHANKPKMAKEWEKETSTKDKPMAQGYKSRQDESLGARRGARKKLKRNVSKAGRRAMASGPRKAAGGRRFGLKKSPTGRS